MTRPLRSSYDVVFVAIWDSSWREERAQSYGIAPDELEEHYRQRTTLKVNIFSEDVAEYAWVLGVRPGYEEEYKQRHDEIWPEMVETLKEAGVRNYSIFRHGLTLFGYFATDDIGRTMEYLANSEVNQRWGEWMEPIMELEIDPNTDFLYLLPLQWHMD